MTDNKRVPTLEEYGRFKRAAEKWGTETPYKREVTRTSYSVELPLSDYEALEKSNWEAKTTSECLYDILEKNTNALDVDYNGHFGCYVFYMLNKEDDTEEEHDKIVHIIHEFILMAKEEND